MSLTEMVLMPGKDYQSICNSLRAALKTDTQISSGMVAEMIDTLASESNTNQDNLDWLLSGEGCDYYENDRITNIASYSFYYAKGPKVASFPNVKSIQMGVFRNNTGIEQASFPNATSSSNNVFQQATNFKKVDFGSIHTIMSSVFNQATSLNIVILRKTDALVSLANVSAFTGTPFASGGTGGRIYVPQALIEAYKTATNWSVLYGYGNCEFLAIEGSEYE